MLGISNHPGKQGILFEQRNARKDTKKLEVAFSARLCRACHEIFSRPFVSLVVKITVTQLC
jgi:hypothetical protein